MHKTDALILLVKSLSKAEKRHFKLYSRKSDYMTLFDIIEKHKDITRQELKKLFQEENPVANFEATANYLYKLLLDSMLATREDQDYNYLLMNKILKTRILFEKNLTEEALDILDWVKTTAEKYENHLAYLYASCLELEYLLALNFPNLSEAELSGKQFKRNEKLKIIRVLNEQATLYELLKYRIIHKGKIRSTKQKDTCNDLVFSEINIVSSAHVISFEIEKRHQLFQSNYLLHTGDYKAALQSFYELNKLFENNKHLWANPPVYYLMSMEGILDSLRSIGKYDEMPYFIERLRNLQYPSTNFQAEVSALIFLYELFPLLDRGDFKASTALVICHEAPEKIHLLNYSRQVEMYFYQALVYFGNKDWKKTQKFLSKISIQGKSFYSMPLYRSVRIVNLMLRYKTHDFSSIRYETRSIKNEISKNEKIYKTERLILRFLNIPPLLTPAQRKKLSDAFLPELEKLRNDPFERQILKLFDFTAFIESELRRIPLDQVMAEKTVER